jgi:hypothetical protein
MSAPLQYQPDYGGRSLVNLMASIAGAFGVRLRYPPLAGVPLPELERARTIVLLAIDGLGDVWLERHAPQGVIRAHRRDAIDSVFPSTTAAAITTFLTGLAPAQHALTGWHVYLRELGAVAAVLPLTLRAGGHSIAVKGEAPPGLFEHAALTARLPVESTVVAPASIVDSPFNTLHSGPARRVAYTTLEGMTTAIARIARSGEGRQYVYAYYPEVDASAHEHGMDSRTTAAEIAKVDAAFAVLLEALRGTDSAVVLTADHGFVDSPPARQMELEHHPELARTLVLPLCGEPRVAYCYVHADRAAAFEREAEAVLGERGRAYRSSDLVAAGWFGPGSPHPRLAERVGHYAIVMADDWTLRDRLLGERRHLQIGVHGGASEAEMRVPLVVATG